MNSVIRDAIRCGALVSTFFCALLLGGYALPAGAAQKSISLSVAPATLSTATTAVFATITNTGNSSANSFEVEFSTSGAFTVNSASARGTTVNCTTPGLKGAGYARCVFLQQLPVKTSVTITLNVTVTGVNQCGLSSASIDWFAFAWTGAPGPASQSFTLAPGPYTTSLPASVSCTVAFVNQPKDAFIGATITNSPFDSDGEPVTVKLLQNGSPASATNVSVSATAACAIATATATTDAFGIATFATLTSGAGATQTSCRLTASATGYGPAAVSDPFMVVKRDGVLGCGDSTNQVDGANGAQAIGRRLNNTDDGLCGDEIPYALFWRDIGNGQQQLQFVKDDLGQAVAMTFNVTWPDEAAPPAVDEIVGVFGAIKLSQQEFIAGEPVPIDLCLGAPVYVPDPLNPGEFILDSLTPPSGGFPDLGPPGGTTQYGCAYDRDVSLPAENIVRLTEFYFLVGDWGASRVNQ